LSDITDEFNFVDQSSLHLNDSTQVNQALVKNKVEGDDKIIQKGLCNDVLLASVGFEITPVDKLVYRSKLPVGDVLTRLIKLELSGLVSAVPGGYIRT
jgi:DNA processing protein